MLKGEAELMKPGPPHVSLLELTLPLNDKKAKAAASKLAGTAQLHRTALPLFETAAAAAVSAAAARIELFAIDGDHDDADGEYYRSHASLEL